MADAKPTKILMTADTVGGVWTYCMEMCSQLQHQNVEVHLVTMGARMSDWQKREVQAFSNVLTYETDYLLEWMQNPWRDIRECGEWLLNLEESIKPDIVHLNCFVFGCYPFNAPTLVVAHSDVYSWYSNVKQDDPPAEWKEYYRCVKKGLKYADMVIAPSEAVKNDLQKIYGVTANVQVIYNGRNKQLFRPASKQEYVFSMGRLWDDAKNMKLVVEAAPKIEVPVKIAGEATFEQTCFPVYKNISFTGKVSTDKIAAYLSAASVYVLPARYEPFGLSALEAALSGCALILGNIPSLREIWGDAAVYVSTHDAGELAEAVNRLMKDRDTLELFQSKAALRAQLFTSEAMCDEYMKVYQQLLQENHLYEKQPAA